MCVCVRVSVWTCVVCAVGSTKFGSFYIAYMCLDMCVCVCVCVVYTGLSNVEILDMFGIEKPVSFQQQATREAEIFEEACRSANQSPARSLLCVCVCSVCSVCLCVCVCVYATSNPPHRRQSLLLRAPSSPMRDASETKTYFLRKKQKCLPSFTTQYLPLCRCNCLFSLSLCHRFKLLQGHRCMGSRPHPFQCRAGHRSNLLQGHLGRA